MSLLILLGACGDNMDVGTLEPGPGDIISPDGVSQPVPRWVPQVCGVQSWTPETLTSDVALDISVAARPTGGATVLSVPQAGGILTGFNVDTRMNMEGVGVKLAIEQTFDRVAVSYVSDRPVATALKDGAVHVHMLDFDLGHPQYITKVPANHIGEAGFLTVQGNIVMPAVDDSGMWMHRFADSLEPIDSKLMKETEPAIAMTSAPLGTALVTAWSTESACYMMVNSTYEPGISTRVAAPCPEPRLSMNQKTGDGVLLFESAEGVNMMTIHTTKLGSNARVIRADAHSPRTLFDGWNHWVSYIDARGDVVVGFLDANKTPVTMSLGAPQPHRTAFELVWVDGAPHVFTLDETGYTAYRMCAVGQ